MKKILIMILLVSITDYVSAASAISSQLNKIIDIVKILKKTPVAGLPASNAAVASNSSSVSQAGTVPTPSTKAASSQPASQVITPSTSASSSTATNPVALVTPFVLNANPKTPDIVQLGTFSPAKFVPIVTNSSQLQGLQPITCQGGLVYLNVGVTDGQGHYLGFNFNAQLFNTVEMQNLITQGMYIIVNKVQFGYFPAVQVLLTDKNGAIYAQGEFNLPVNVNPTTYAVAFNDLQSNTVNGTTSQGVASTPIGTPLYYKQASYTPPASFWIHGLNTVTYGADLGNVNIANITPIVQAKFFTDGAFNVGSTPFAAQTTQPSAASIYNVQPYTCAQDLQVLNVGIYDGVKSYVDFNFGPDVFAAAQMKNLCSLGLFINLELVPATATTQASFNVYLTDALGTVYAQASSPAGAINPNATPVYYNIGFNNNLPSFIGVSSIPLNAVAWYQNGSVAVANPALNASMKSPVAPATSAPVVTSAVNTTSEPVPTTPSTPQQAEAAAYGYGDY